MGSLHASTQSLRSSFGIAPRDFRDLNSGLPLSRSSIRRVFTSSPILAHSTGDTSSRPLRTEQSFFLHRYPRMSPTITFSVSCFRAGARCVDVRLLPSCTLLRAPGVTFHTLPHHLLLFEMPCESFFLPVSFSSPAPFSLGMAAHLMTAYKSG